MRVLLVENDVHIGQSLFCALKGAAYTDDWVRDGKAGKDAIGNAYYAVALLNLGLPGICGIDLLKASRAAGNSVPVLLLSAHDDPETRARMRAWRESTPRDKDGAHRYEPADFGIDLEALEKRFRFYSERFNLPTAA